MFKRVFTLILGVTIALTAGAAVALASSIPSGERIVGRTVIEPVYDDMTGAIRYVSTPMGAPNPVKSPPIAAAPFYLPVYPTGSTVGTLVCQDVPQENCPDHGAAVAGAAQAIMPSVYSGGVIGHDHLMAGPGSGGDFNIAWVPILVLFTSNAAANQHLILLTDVNAAVAGGQAILVPLDGTHGTPNLTFHCSVVPAAVYARGIPFLGS
ncbi:MAG TPA: hypothetical protein VIO80_07680 [Candidatus Dormibacteraeota bacterium]|jgi:hypothetical protein